MRVSEHENGGSERKREGSETKEEDERVEAPELLYGHSGVERRGWESMRLVVRRWGFPISSCLSLRGSHDYVDSDGDGDC